MSVSRNILEILIRAVDQTKPGSEAAGRSLHTFAAKAAAAMGPLGTAIGAVGDLLLANFAGEKIAEAFNSAIERMTALRETALRVEMPVDEFDRLQYAARQAGVEGGELERAMWFLERAIDEAKDPASKAAMWFGRMGINIRETGNQAKNAGEVLRELPGGMERLADAGARANATVELLGRGGRALKPFLAEGGEGIEELIHKADRFGTVTEGMVEKSHQLRRAQEDLHRSMNSLVNFLAAGAAPALSMIDEWLALQLGKFIALQRAIEKYGKTLGEALGRAFAGRRPRVSTDPADRDLPEPAQPPNSEVDLVELRRIHLKAEEELQAHAKIREERAKTAAQALDADMDELRRIHLKAQAELEAHNKIRENEAEALEEKKAAELEWFNRRLEIWREGDAQMATEAQRVAEENFARMEDAAYESAQRQASVFGSAFQSLANSLVGLLSGEKVKPLKAAFLAVLGTMLSIGATILTNIILTKIWAKEMKKVADSMRAASVASGLMTALSLLAFGGGGNVPHAATGILVPGTPGLDRTPILASGGEMVLTERQANMMRGALREPQAGTGREPRERRSKITFDIVAQRPFTEAEQMRLLDSVLEGERNGERLNRRKRASIYGRKS